MIGGKSIKVYNKIRKKKRKSIRPELCERMSAKKGWLYMIAFGLNISENLGNEQEEQFYPEWVKTERLYNCENFTRIFSGRLRLLERFQGILPKRKGSCA